MYCKHCGEKLNDGVTFCFACGKNILLSEQQNIQANPSKEPPSFLNKKVVINEKIVFLILIITSVALIFYFVGYPKIKNFYQNKKIQDQQTQNFIQDQQLQLESVKKELEKVKEKTAKSVTLVDGVKNDNILSSEISKYLSGVVQVGCFLQNNEEIQGSGSLWNFEGLNSVVITNSHVAGEGNCYVTVNKEKNDIFGSGIYNLGKDRLNWNSLTDVAVLKITSVLTEESVSLEKLNYNISKLPTCEEEMDIGSPVVIIGYPAFAVTDIDLGTKGLGSLSNRTLTNGVISGYDTSVKYNQGLPYPNYFVSAKIDSGNSGGIAISKRNNELCVLGLPTWVSVGNYDTSGIIQNIHNIFYVKK